MSHGYPRGVPIDTDANMAANSDFFVTSQKAIKTYVDNKTGTEILGATVIRATDQTPTNNASNAVSFSSVVWDYGSFWNASQPTRLTIPAGKGGRYYVGGCFRLDGTGTGRVYCQIQVNGGGSRFPTTNYKGTGDNFHYTSCGGILELNAGDYIELICGPYLSSGPTIKAETSAGNLCPIMVCCRISPSSSVRTGGNREVLAGPRTYYVRTDGSDSNTGLANTAGGAFLTPQKAIDVVSGTLDMGTYQVTIQIGNGTYTLSTFIECKPYIGSTVPRILGSTATPSNVVFTRSTTGVVFYSATNNPWRLSGVTIGNTGAGSSDGIRMFGGILFGESLRFTAVTRYMINVDTGGIFSAETAITIAGNAAAFIVAGISGTVTMGGATVTMSGTPAFSSWTVLSSSGGVVFAGNTWSGAATGTRYLANLNGVINVNAGGANWIPGNAAGSTATGGQYA
jgi:hypothetical protein